MKGLMPRVGGRRWRPHVNHSPECRTILISKKNKKCVTLLFFVSVGSSLRGLCARGTMFKIALVVTSVLYNRRLRRLLFGDSMRARWDCFNMIDLFILYFKGAFLRLLVNLITKCFISGHVKFSFIDKFLLTLFIPCVGSKCFEFLQSDLVVYYYDRYIHLFFI